MIHALITLAAIGIARRAATPNASPPQRHLMSVMVVTALVLMMAHTAEIGVWSIAYALVGAAPTGSDLLDFAFVNYTTLGYGDVTPLKEWRLLGPMTAMNGILMFGWSTAVLFEGGDPEHLFGPELLPAVAAGPAGRFAADLGQGSRECPCRADWTANVTQFPALAPDSLRYRGGTSAVPGCRRPPGDGPFQAGRPRRAPARSCGPAAACGPPHAGGCWWSG